MVRTSRKILLPRLTLTKVVTAEDPGAIRVALPDGAPSPAYFVQPIHSEIDSERRDRLPLWMGTRFNLFPLVLDANGAPWAEAVIYVLSRLQGTVAPSMDTYSSIASDLSAFRRFIDEYPEIDWTHFPAYKLNRPTYRYNAHLRRSIAAGDIAPTTAKRRMSNVIAFYRWLQADGLLVPAHEPWKSSDRYIELKNSLGFKFTKQVTTTDVSIRTPKQADPYAGTIDDGGKLRPLTEEEQGWLLEALLAKGNTEMTLIHLFGLLTGARIQTILTFQVQHVTPDFVACLDGEVRIPVGPGTGIDSKNDKQLVLHIPAWFYQKLHTYAGSDRARRRRLRAKGGDSANQYLFLSVRGAPLYLNNLEKADFDEENSRRHQKAGQGVRQFITDRIIPYIRENHEPQFWYRFHDTRASFGMNLTDHQLKLVTSGEVTLHQAREFVKNRMGHESAATTDSYLQYRSNLKFVRQTEREYENHLRTLTDGVLEGKA